VICAHHAIALAACTLACGAGASSTIDTSASDAAPDSLEPDGVDGNSFSVGPTDAGGAIPDAAVIPVASPDAAGCVEETSEPLVVCFGADAAPYAYLVPDAGVAVGQCPKAGDFASAATEGMCGYTTCGPLLPSAVGAIMHGGGQQVEDGGAEDGCCFLVVEVCGV
jgi:hypothetical protein